MAYILQCAVFWLVLASSSFASELKIIVHTATGGHMIHARVFAKHLAKYTSDSVVIRAMPGASGIVAANYLYASAVKDGSEIGTLDTRVFLQGVTKPDTIQYDLGQFNLLGAAVDNRREPFLLMAKAGSDRLVSGSESSFPINNIAFINSVLKWDIKEITGYSNSSQVKLAFERGEINLVAYNLTGIKTTAPDWLKTSTVMPLVQYGSGLTRHKDFPFVPTVMEFAATPNDIELIEAFERVFTLGRAFAAPPNVPKSRLNHLRSLFEKTMKDDEYKDDASKVGVEISPIYWREAEDIVGKMSKTSSTISNKLRQF